MTVVEDADLLTLYLHQPPGRFGPQVPRALDTDWRRCRVLGVSSLLRALAFEFDARPDGMSPPMRAEVRQRDKHLSALLFDELRRARPVPLGVALPRDRRLRALCEAVLDDPTRHGTLEGWADDSGASTRTIARLFRSELGSTFVQWRQQVLLAKAVAMAGRKLPMSHIAAELGYACASAFSAMVRRSVGAPPRRFLS